MQQISIESFTPYDSLFPGQKFLDKEVLILVKTLRTAGHDVTLLPKDIKYQYIFKKGETSFLADPANLLLIGIPITIATTLIANWIQKLLDKNQLKKAEPNTIIINNTTTNQTVNYLNHPVADSAVKELKADSHSLSSALADCLRTQSPYPELPFPILLEHQPQIVGWCTLKIDDTGLLIDEGRITDVDTYKRIASGELKGGSVTGVAIESMCSICKGDYISCNHIAGQKYEGMQCTNRIVKAGLIEVSIVSAPINSKTLIKLL
ncbi:hypothetical protein [Hymenobacter nivis]|uniref:hypothetical protein n=1 Tax=Hymenobacter nivis TaxID=1850093 RepID=UPI00112BCB5B|nr:hypothetical protein [Hymenobacter nivis]